MLALRFARSVAPTASALRFSILPLIDSIMHLAFDRGVESSFLWTSGNRLSAEHECEIRRSAINLQSFTHTKYFETELHRHIPPKARICNISDSDS